MSINNTYLYSGIDGEYRYTTDENNKAEGSVDNNAVLGDNSANSGSLSVRNSSGDLTIKNLNNDPGANNPSYYYPEELQNPNSNPQNTPRNVIKISIKDFGGGLLQDDIHKYAALSALKGDESPEEIAKAINSPDLGTDKNAFSTVTTLGKDLGVKDIGRVFTGVDAAYLNNDTSKPFTEQLDQASKSYSIGFNAASGKETALDKAKREIRERIFSQPPITTIDPPLATVYLYAPEELSSSYAAVWREEDLTPTYKVTDIVKSLVSGSGADKSKVVDIVTQAGVNFLSSVMKIPGIGGDVDFNAFAKAKTRSTPVLNFEYLFERVDRRTFKYEFKFYPKSKDEIENVIKILTAFKYYAMPVQADNSRYMKSPPAFIIEYLTVNSKGEWKPNAFLNKIKPCALTNVDINYTEAGKFATLKIQNGHELEDSVFKSPVAMSISLAFQELQLLTRSDITDPSDLFTAPYRSDKGH